ASAGAGMGEIVAVSTVIGAIIFTILFWLIGSAIFYLISMAFKGTGGYNRTLEFVGYGFIPQIFGSLLTLIMAVYYLPMVKVPVVNSFTDPVVIQNAVTRMMHDSAMMEFTKVSAIIAIIFLIWSANIWIYAIKYSRNLTIKHAAITILIPVIIYIVYTLFMTFVGFSAPGGY
ncbi:MAG: Yip1 family protein, partial [Methanomicrobiales archaeon]